MSSPRSLLEPAQEPRLRSEPKRVRSEADGAAFLASSYGLTPDPWQHLVITAWFGRGSDGKYSAGRCGLAVPRQNGKNGILEIVELFKLVVHGRRILHTAHEVKTARKAFQRLCGFFENARQWPELAALVKEIRRTNGQEAIVLTNGGSIEFVARSRGSGRGYTVDDLVCDEAQELTDEQLEALLPTISAAPSGDPQQIYTGTPPGPTSPGEVFTRMRNAGVKGKDKRLSWHEWSVDGNVDIHDRSHWYATNPALGKRLNLAVVLDELAAMTPEGFARERLGQWADATTTGVIDWERWSGNARPAEPVDNPVVLSVETTLDRSTSSIVAVGSGVAGPRAKHLKSGAGTGWVPAMVVQIATEHPEVGTVVIDGKAQAASLAEAIEDALLAGDLPVEVVLANTSDLAEACAVALERINDGTLTHGSDQELDAAVRGAVTRDLGDNAWAWSRRKGGPTIAPLVAMSLALWKWLDLTAADYDPADSFG